MNKFIQTFRIAKQWKTLLYYSLTEKRYFITYDIKLDSKQILIIDLR